LTKSTEVELNEVLECVGEKQLTWDLFESLDAETLNEWIPCMLDALDITSMDKLKKKTRILSIWARRPGAPINNQKSSHGKKFDFSSFFRSVNCFF